MKEFQRQLYCKNWFFDQVFNVNIDHTDNESLNPLHTPFDKYLNHLLMKFEQNTMDRTIQNMGFLANNELRWSTIFDNFFVILRGLPYDWNNYCLMLNCYHLSLFLNLRKSDTSKEVRLKVVPNVVKSVLAKTYRSLNYKPFYSITFLYNKPTYHC